MKSNIAYLYEELRKAIDGGSESMTHDDALKQIAYWQDNDQAQAQEPVAWLVRWRPTKHEPRDINPWVALSIAEYRSNPSREERPLFTHPAPPPAQQVLSLDLLERLSKTLINLGYSTPEGGMEHFCARIESQLYNLCNGVDSILAQQVAVPVPLTDEQIKEITSDNSLDTIHAVVRAIEAHHKIGAKK